MIRLTDKGNIEIKLYIGNDYRELVGFIDNHFPIKNTDGIELSRIFMYQCLSDNKPVIASNPGLIISKLEDVFKKVKHRYGNSFYVYKEKQGNYFEFKVLIKGSRKKNLKEVYFEMQLA